LARRHRRGSNRLHHQWQGFQKLAAATGLHPGVIVIPGGHAPSAQFNLTMTALNWVSTSNAPTGLTNRYIVIGDNGGIVLTEIVYNEKDWRGPPIGLD
jgi:hypothetical protein